MPKGCDTVLQIAKKLKKKTIISGLIQNKMFFENKIKPLIKNLSNLVTFIEKLTFVEKNKILSNPKLFLFPIQWEEPFGLVMIEAMATGTPVVAFARGSAPEVIKDGKTRFIVNPSDDDIRGDFIIKKTGIEGLCEAVERIYSMPEEQYRKMRKACREHVEKNFTVEKMVDEYEKIYKEILNKKTS